VIPLAVAVARAAPLVPAFDQTSHWKIEVYSYEPATNPYSSDWIPTEMEVVAVSLTCAPSGRPRIDHCRPIDGKVYWGYREVGGDTVKLFELSNPNVLEIAYSDRGKVLRYDWQGDRTQFRHDACNALLHLDRTVNTDKRVCTEDGARRVGERFEERLSQNLLGALDVELPKAGEHGGKAWKPTAAPMAGRRYLTGTMASSNGTWSETAPGALQFAGQVSERPGTAGSVSAYATDSAVSIQVKLNAAGRPATLEAHTVATSTQTLYGHSQTDTWLTSLDPPASTPPGRDPRAPAE
jgi:hypothetical protein